MANVDDVAAAVLERTGTIDTFKLQKLVYYSQAWHLVWEDKPLFPDPIEAWAAGPVVRTLYNHHRGLYSVSEWEWGNSSALKKRERRSVKSVVDSYGRLSGRQLSHLTHQERPWRTARGDLGPTDRGAAEITLADMYSYYSALDADATAPRVIDLEDDGT